MAILLLPLISLACCKPLPDTKWPSLALRTGEVQPLVARPAAAGTGTAASPAMRDVAARQSSLERDLAAYEKRLRAQLGEAGKVQVGEAGSVPVAGDDAAATAQLERTRLDRLGSQAEDLREQFNELAGDLARQAAAGGDVTAALAQVGTAIEKVEALRAEQAAATAAAPAVPKP